MNGTNIFPPISARSCGVVIAMVFASGVPLRQGLEAEYVSKEFPRPAELHGKGILGKLRSQCTAAITHEDAHLYNFPFTHSLIHLLRTICNLTKCIRNDPSIQI